MKYFTNINFNILSKYLQLHLNITKDMNVYK